MYSRVSTKARLLALVCAISISLPLFDHGAASRPLPVQSPTTCGPHCGTERWGIKTLSDSHAGSVDLQQRQVVTVHSLVSIDPPGQLPADNRISPVELTTFGVQAQLIGFKIESDQDFHMVIGDDQSHETMIVEIPNPKCDGVCASHALQLITQARQTFIKQCGTPTATYRRLTKPLEVRITGVGFFDFAHGQIGRAKNSIELHPVLGIEFPDQTDDCARHVVLMPGSQNSSP